MKASATAVNVPAFEAMEGRLLMSGTVNVTYSAKSVTITGDGGDNAITIAAPVGGSFDVYGGDGDTMFVYKGTAPASGSKVSVKIKMGDGDDKVTFNDYQVGAVTADLGAGDDDINFMSTGSIFGNVSVKTGEGANVVQVSSVQLYKALSITGGSGTEIVELDTHVVGKVTANLGAGTDTFYSAFSMGGVLNSTFDSLVTLNMGDGDDTVVLNGGNSANTVDFNGGFKLDMGKGIDRLNIDMMGDDAVTRFSKNTTFNFGEGDDTTAGMNGSSVYYQAGAKVTIDGSKLGTKNRLLLNLLDGDWAKGTTLNLKW